tara:strand:+ start:1385 stop:2281 length:897 start_codon:yes stop_codon:yes gene_type:complete
MFKLENFIPINSNVNFLKLRKPFIFLSSIFIIFTIVLLFTRGLNLGIDFRGGLLLEAEIKDTNISNLRSILSDKYDDVTIQEFGSKNNVVIKLQNNQNIDNITLITNIKNLIDEFVIEFRRSEFVGPTISKELFLSGLKAISFALISILIYIWFRFEWHFGIGAIVALLHDVLFTLGILSILKIDFNLSTIAAILTIAGYSINDTVVIFDRVRENLRKYKKMELVELFNLSLNNTLARTIMTSVTTLIALFSLFILGGDVIRSFSFTMIIGVLIGTYSSIFISIPTLLLFKFRQIDQD